MKKQSPSFATWLVGGSLALLLSAPGQAQPALPNNPAVAPVLQETLDDYHWLHSHPELSSKEFKTSQYLAQKLREAGLEVTEGVGGTGLLAVLRGKSPGPLVLYRADMDALPITEKTGLPYASQNKGVMHACGHDIHMSTALGTLRALSREKDSWNGTILFVGQPAEETGSGAEAMLSDPKFSALLAQLGGPPEVAIALHDDPTMLAGQGAMTAGYITANVDSVDILVKGQGGHGAEPNTTVDPIIIGAEIVGALQTIVSRKLPPGTPAVVTVGVFRAGTKRNIIPSEALLQLTIRSYEDSVRMQIVEEIKRISNSIAAAHGAPEPPEINHHADAYTPAGKNDPVWTKRLRPVMESVVGKSQVFDLPPSMVGEDFSEYSRRLKIPSVMYLVGTGRPDSTKRAGLHTAYFAPAAEPTLKTSIAVMRACLLEALKG